MLGSSAYKNIWVGKAEGTTDIFEHHLHVVHISLLYFFERVPNQTTYAISTRQRQHTPVRPLSRLNYLPACGLALIEQLLGISTSDNNTDNIIVNNNNNNNSNENNNDNDSNNSNNSSNDKTTILETKTQKVNINK